MLLEDSPRNIGSYWKLLRSDFYAVIVAGDASPAGFDHLRSVLRQYFSGLPPSWLKDSIDPKAVSTIGAAVRARDMVENPKVFKPYIQYIDFGEL